MSTPALEARHLVKTFGAFCATDDACLSLAPGSRHALIGPNGAGKTTLVNLLTGALTPSSGSVWLNGADVTALPQHLRVRRGLARTFQINRLFADLTVLESIALAVSEQAGLGWRLWAPLGAHKPVLEGAARLVEQLKLTDVAHRRTRDLAYGKQRLLEIALALAAQPRVLLLDEPAAGVPTSESRELFETLAAMPRDVTILLIEHDMDLVFAFADRISLLVAGHVRLEDTPDVVANHPLVREVYLGEAEHA